jgi:hypothetical protein
MGIRSSCRIIPLQIVQSQSDARMSSCLAKGLGSATQSLIQPPFIARILYHTLLKFVFGVVFEFAERRPDGSCILHVFVGISLLLHRCASIGASGVGVPLKMGVACVDGVGRRRGKRLEGLARCHFLAAVLS